MSFKGFFTVAEMLYNDPLYPKLFIKTASGLLDSTVISKYFIENFALIEKTNNIRNNIKRFMFLSFVFRFC